jgi:hypothetical protein
MTENKLMLALEISKTMGDISKRLEEQFKSKEPDQEVVAYLSSMLDIQKDFLHKYLKKNDISN